MKLFTSYNTILLATFVVYGLLVGNLFAQKEGGTSETVSALSDSTGAARESIDHANVSADLPVWIKRGNYRGADGTDYVIVTAGPDIDLTTVRKRMKDSLVAETNAYIDQELETGASTFFDLKAADISSRFLVKDREHLEKVDVSIGTMLSQHQQLAFSQSFREELSSRWKERKSRHRLAQIGMTVGGVLISLLIVFCCFRINQATRGFYAGRLQFAAVAAILTLIISGVYIGRFL